ncbi:MAG: hypothetical protein HC836_17710 [Richelia sp. RM2_1_2]|nr:hypothetical protein [Richelia sp. SM2_1_7]NJM19506.1 hypothetical protein [Richelia sp. SM1_7_0]NJN09849.1 hypothetical protein [Richelia sp. RM1_1_1]NJO28183.1 hypothetical protein [Richelia sp. SL_2_1]NJO60036.1 hypothetical protein [Richelia sp. RM2_1_2]
MSTESVNSKSSQAELNLGLFSISQSVILQAGTVSVLTLVLAEKATREALIAVGQASEELFRGERLPLLDFPTSNSAD